MKRQLGAAQGEHFTWLAQLLQLAQAGLGHRRSASAYSCSWETSQVWQPRLDQNAAAHVSGRHDGSWHCLCSIGVD